MRVMKKAIDIMDRCTCDPSCYSCLRNYYNQGVHDILNRFDAAEFLREFDGEVEEGTTWLDGN